TGETIILACPADLFSVQYFYKKNSAKTIQFTVPQGVIRNIHESTCGIAIASQYDDTLIESIAKNIRLSQSKKVSDQFVENVARCREQHYYLSRGQFTDGAGV